MFEFYYMKKWQRLDSNPSEPQPEAYTHTHPTI